MGIPTFGERGGGQAGWNKIPTLTENFFWMLPYSEQLNLGIGTNSFDNKKIHLCHYHKSHSQEIGLFPVKIHITILTNTYVCMTYNNLEKYTWQLRASTCAFTRNADQQISSPYPWKCSFEETFQSVTKYSKYLDQTSPPLLPLANIIAFWKKRLMKIFYQA